MLGGKEVGRATQEEVSPIFIVMQKGGKNSTGSGKACMFVFVCAPSSCTCSLVKFATRGRSDTDTQDTRCVWCAQNTQSGKERRWDEPLPSCLTRTFCVYKKPLSSQDGKTGHESKYYDFIFTEKGGRSVSHGRKRVTMMMRRCSSAGSPRSDIYNTSQPQVLE